MNELEEVRVGIAVLEVIATSLCGIGRMVAEIVGGVRVVLLLVINRIYRKGCLGSSMRSKTCGIELTQRGRQKAPSCERQHV